MEHSNKNKPSINTRNTFVQLKNSWLTLKHIYYSLLTKKKAQIPVVFVFVFALIVAGLLLAWGVSSITKIVNLSGEADFQITINELKNTVEKMYYYDEGSEKAVSLELPQKLQQFCFVQDKTRQLKTQNQELKFLIQNSEFNLFVLPLDAFKTTGFKIPYLRGASNPECIQQANGILKLKLTTKFDSAINDNYVEVSQL